MDKSGAKFKFVGHSTEIIRQSKNKGTLRDAILHSLDLLKFQSLEFQIF